MNFFTPTNTGRVDKMIDIINLLQKSAQSNKATGEDIMNLLAPLVQAIEELVTAQGGPGASSSAKHGHTPPATEEVPVAAPVQPEKPEPNINNVPMRALITGRTAEQLMDIIYLSVTQLDLELVKRGLKESK